MILTPPRLFFLLKKYSEMFIWCLSELVSPSLLLFFLSCHLGMKFNFKNHLPSRINSQNIDYGYNRLIHHGSTTFAKLWGLMTSQKKSKEGQSCLGQGNGLSEFDEKDARLLNDCSPKTEKRTSKGNYQISNSLELSLQKYFLII